MSDGDASGGRRGVDDPMVEARRRIAEEAERRTGLLNLSGLLKLRALPGEIAGLAGLQSLDCRGTQIRSVAPLAGLAGLQSLNCSLTPLNDLAPLAGLAGLQSLNCSLTLLNDLAPLAGLASLQSLDCSSTQVDDLTPLAGLAALRSLVCRRTEVDDLTPLAGLANLRELDCRGTPISSLAPLAGVAGLQSLDCSGTQVADLAPLAGLMGLEQLDASECRLVAFPEALLRLPALENLVLDETVIPGVPGEILSKTFRENCLDALRAYFAARDAGGAAPMDARLLLLGNGRAGKTQIARWLRGEAFDERVPSTHGIQLWPLDLPGLGRVQIWDFGGQDIYHGTHALFLRSPAVLAGVWARGLEPDQTPFHQLDGLEFHNHPLAYWAALVRHLRHEASPVLFVQAQCDTPAEEVQPFPIPAATREALPWKRELHVSAKADLGREELVAALGRAIRVLRDPKGPGVPVVGAGWLRVQRRIEALRAADAALPLEQRQHRWISQKAFAALCAEAGEVPAPAQALRWLDASGAVFHRPGLFEDRIILDQGWALEAIYAVFDRSGPYQAIRGQGGRFTRFFLGLSVWRGLGDPEQRLLLGMMRSCGICFLHRPARGRREEDSHDEYIAPELLPGRAAVEDALAGRWDAEVAGTRAAFRYPLLHSGLIRGVMARIGALAGADALYWKDGLCGYEAGTRSRVLIEQEAGAGEGGTLTVTTQRGAAEALLAQVIELVERVEAEVGLRSEREAAPRAALRKAAEPAPPLQFTQEKPVGAEWFVSYAWGDDKTPEGRARDAAVEALCAAAVARGITIVRDKDVLGFGDRISQFMARIGAADRVFVILSEKYLHSPHCMFELSEVWRTSRQEGAAFLQRIRMYGLPGTRLADPNDWVDCAIHWKTQHDALDARAREHGAAILGELGQRRLLLMQRFYTQVTDILGTLADTVQPGSIDDLATWAFDEKA